MPTYLALVSSFYFNESIYLSIFKLVEENTECTVTRSMVKLGRCAIIVESAKAMLKEIEKKHIK